MELVGLAELCSRKQETVSYRHSALYADLWFAYDIFHNMHAILSDPDGYAYFLPVFLNMLSFLVSTLIFISYLNINRSLSTDDRHREPPYQSPACFLLWSLLSLSLFKAFRLSFVIYSASIHVFVGSWFQWLSQNKFSNKNQVAFGNRTPAISRVCFIDIMPPDDVMIW